MYISCVTALIYKFAELGVFQSDLFQRVGQEAHEPFGQQLQILNNRKLKPEKEN